MDVLQQKLLTAQRQAESTHPAVITSAIIQAAALATLAEIEAQGAWGDDVRLTQMRKIAETARAIALATLPTIKKAP